MKVTTSSSGKWHGLVVPIKKRSQGCNRMKRWHEGCNLLKWQVAWFGSTHEDKATSTSKGNPMGLVWSYPSSGNSMGAVWSCT